MAPVEPLTITIGVNKTKPAGYVIPVWVPKRSGVVSAVVIVTAVTHCIAQYSPIGIIAEVTICAPPSPKDCLSIGVIGIRCVYYWR